VNGLLSMKGHFNSSAKSRNCHRRSNTCRYVRFAGVRNRCSKIHKGNVKRPGKACLIYSVACQGGSTWNRKLDIEECKFNAGEVMHPLEPLLKVQRRHLNEGIVNRD
jgi:hypothetical protein